MRALLLVLLLGLQTLADPNCSCPEGDPIVVPCGTLPSSQLSSVVCLSSVACVAGVSYSANGHQPCTPCSTCGGFSEATSCTPTSNTVCNTPAPTASPTLPSDTSSEASSGIFPNLSDAEAAGVIAGVVVGLALIVACGMLIGYCVTKPPSRQSPQTLSAPPQPLPDAAFAAYQAELPPPDFAPPPHAAGYSSYDANGSIEMQPLPPPATGGYENYSISGFSSQSDPMSVLAPDAHGSISESDAQSISLSSPDMFPPESPEVHYHGGAQNDEYAAAAPPLDPPALPAPEEYAAEAPALEELPADVPLCSRPGCGELSQLQCPICEPLGFKFPVCSQACLELAWDEHAANTPNHD